MRSSEKRFSVLTILAVFVGLVTLVSILFLPLLGQSLLAGGTILAAFALVLGVLNLLRVHSGRVASERNLFSLVLVVSMVAVFILAVTDGLGVTVAGVETIFSFVQAPLETAVAALLAFVLLFAGFRMLQQQRTAWSLLFIVTAVFFLLTGVPFIGNSFVVIRNLLEETVITAGMRGIFIGVALGSLTIAIRLLLGLDQPYNK